MILKENEKDIMISILRTLIYNDFKDLKIKIKEIRSKNLISYDKYHLLLFGNKDLNGYRVIEDLGNRWCLQSILYYHLNRTKKITESQYNEIILSDSI